MGQVDLSIGQVLMSQGHETDGARVRIKGDAGGALF